MFCFSLVVNTIKEFLFTPLSDEELINLLVENIVKTLAVKNKTGDLFYIDKRAASRLMNNKANIPLKIKGALSEEAASVDKLERHLKEKICVLIIPEQIGRVCQILADAIFHTENVPETVTEEINRCKENNDYARLIAAALRFSFMVPNKSDKAVEAAGKSPVNDSKQKPESPLQKIFGFLKESDCWDQSYSVSSDIRYYRYAPEYTIEHTFESEDGLDGYEYYLFTQRDPTPHWTDIRLKYHQTVLYQIQGALLDGGRYFTPCPEWGIIRPFDSQLENVLYKYLVTDSPAGIIHSFYYNNTDPEERYAHDRFTDSIIVFSNEEERAHFEEYTVYRWDEYQKRKSNVRTPYIEAASERVVRHYENIFKNVRVLQIMYREFTKTEYRGKSSFIPG